MKEELIILLNHQTLNITDQSENKWKVVEASDIQDIIDKSREGLHDYTLKTDEEIIKILCEFGSGETDFHTADVERLLKQKQWQEKRIEELEEVMKTTLFDSDCVNNVTNLSVFNRQVIENCLKK